MAFMSQRVASTLWSWLRRAGQDGRRTEIECVVLQAKPGAAPSSKPPVRIFLGTEGQQHRAERVFVWSIKQVRDPARVYEIYLMKDLAGFDRSRWLTGFTNYRFAIPHLAGCKGRAIYNDVDQIYLTDPARLFDAPMGCHGFLSISDRDTSVMLLDCARMAPVWPMKTVQRRSRKFSEAKARAIADLWGPLEPEWNARDEEYVPGRSRLVHYTTLHTQPWQPFPQHYVYQKNQVGSLWLDMERAADRAGYRLFNARRPSSRLRALCGQLGIGGNQPWRFHVGLPKSLPAQEAQAVGLAVQAAVCDSVVTCTLESEPDKGCRFDNSSSRAVLNPDAVICPHVLEHLPDEDVPWVIETLFQRAERLVHILVEERPHTRSMQGGGLPLPLVRDSSWWEWHLKAASIRHPQVHWKLMSRKRGLLGGGSYRLREGGRILQAPPNVWVLADGKPGHTTQSLGLARALGWPHQVKTLPLRPRLGRDLPEALGLPSSPFKPPWPDVVIATGWLPTRVARRIHRQSGGQVRLVLQGRKAGPINGAADVMVSCAHFRLPLHPRRIETLLPPTQVNQERLEEARRGMPQLFSNAPHPHVVLLAGGDSRQHRLDAATARTMGQQVAEFAQAAGGSIFCITSRRTGPAATRALRQGLGAKGHIYEWRRDDPKNPYLAYLAAADALVVSGESESMLAEAVDSAKPVYIYPLPARRPGIWQRIGRWVGACAESRPLGRRQTVRPQQGLEYLCARLIEHGIILPPRDLESLHRALVRKGMAKMFGAPLETRLRHVVHETDRVASRVRQLLAYAPVASIPVPSSGAICMDGPLA